MSETEADREKAALPKAVNLGVTIQGSAVFAIGGHPGLFWRKPMDGAAAVTAKFSPQDNGWCRVALFYRLPQLEERLRAVLAEKEVE